MCGCWILPFPIYHYLYVTVVKTLTESKLYELLIQREVRTSLAWKLQKQRV